MGPLHCHSWLTTMSEYNLAELETKHPIYPEFSTWLREHSEVAIRDRSLWNYIYQLETMRNKYGFNLSLKKPKVRPVLDAMTKKKLAPSTMNLRRHVLRLWVKFKGIEIDDELTKLFKKRPAERKRKLHPTDLLTLEEVCDIAEHTQSKSLSAYFLCLWDTGCRPNELAKMKVSDVEEDRHGFIFTFRQAKNEESRRAVRLIEPKAIVRFSQYWKDHPRLDDPTSPVFINQRDEGVMAPSLLSYLKKQHQERLGRKGKPLTLYLFRFSRATQLLRDNVMKEIEVKRRMGHTPGSNILEKVYAILSEEDQAKAELRSMGVVEAEEGKQQPVICPGCGLPNDADSSSCQRCRLPLTEQEVTRQQQVATAETLENLKSTGVLQDLVSEAVEEALRRSQKRKV